MHTLLHGDSMLLETSLVTFIVASIVILVVPGPSVTIIVANSLKSGVKAGFLTIAGTQAGLALILVILALGLEAITTTLAGVFDWLRWIGGAYIIWLGYKLLRSDGDLGQAESRKGAERSHFWHGFVVILSNPKVLFFFGAFLPQFISPDANAGLQTLFLGAIFMILATFLDGLYAIAAGKAGALLTRNNVRAVEIGGGSLMIGGGLWLALDRS